jgi:CheY-like chemotaxis protein
VLAAHSVVAKPLSTREALVAAVESLWDYVARPTRELLVIQEGPLAAEILSLIGSDEVKVTTASSVAAAADRFWRTDCLVIGPDVPEAEIEALADQMRQAEAPGAMSLVVYGRHHLSPTLEVALKRLSRDMTVRLVTSPERLVDQCSLLLHRPVGAMPAHQRQVLEELHHGDRALAGRKVLIVDDDIRNIFALTSILERRDMTIISAETGRAAIAALEATPDVDVVLMDVMMPEMDGFETTRAIRQKPQFKDLPIIAVTAKAMKGDREKCIEAGAWDYLSKPVDVEELVSMLRAWLFR